MTQEELVHEKNGWAAETIRRTHSRERMTMDTLFREKED
jgi:hypothetical protein